MCASVASIPFTFIFPSILYIHKHTHSITFFLIMVIEALQEEFLTFCGNSLGVFQCIWWKTGWATLPLSSGGCYPSPPGTLKMDGCALVQLEGQWEAPLVVTISVQSYSFNSSSSFCTAKWYWFPFFPLLVDDSYWQSNSLPIVRVNKLLVYQPQKFQGSMRHWKSTAGN